jgi:hypothetical protein
MPDHSQFNIDRPYPGRWIKLTLVQIGEQDRIDDKTVSNIK